MKQMELLDRRDEPLAGAPPNSNPQRFSLQRTLTVESLGDPWRGKVYSGIRLKGQWLTKAGFNAGQRVSVAIVSPGVMDLRLVGNPEAAGEQDTVASLERPRNEAHQKELLPALPASPADLEITCHGSLSLFHPITEKSSAWLRAHCPPGENHQHRGLALAVEARYVPDLRLRAQESGLVVNP